MSGSRRSTDDAIEQVLDRALEAELVGPPATPPKQLPFLAIDLLDDESATYKSSGPDEVTPEEIVEPIAVESALVSEKSPPEKLPGAIVAEAVGPIQLIWPKSWPMKIWYGLCFGLESLFGVASVVVFLAFASAIPIVQFVSLGYLLEASGRVARTGKLRDGFIDTHLFARIGSVVAGTWLMLLPLRFLSDLAYSAALIDPDGPATRAWRLGLLVATVLMVGHIVLAWYSGGRLRHFFWPLLAPFQLGMRLMFGGIVGPLVRPAVEYLSPHLAADLYVPRPLSEWFPPAILWSGLWRGKVYAEARDSVWDFVRALELPHYFMLGLKGFLGALAWLAIPGLLMMAGTTLPSVAGFLLGWLGALLMATVVLYLPFLQTNLAATNRFWTVFDLRLVRQQFRRAPIAFWLSLAITLLFAIPLYLLTIEYTPRELTWLPSLVFVVFIYPARLLTGWAVGRAEKREQPRFFLVRWMARLAAIPIVLWYVLIVFITQFTSWHGAASLLEQHAFLVPVPLLGL